MATGGDGWRVARDERRPSKTQRKKAMHELRDLGAELVALSGERLASLALPEFLHDAVVDARGITAHGARRRQLQYIGRLMREVDAEPIRARLDGWRAQSRAPALAHQQAEAWRNRLLDEDGALAELPREYPRADVIYLKKLAEATVRERDAGLPPRSFRLLFQALRALLERNA